VGGGFYMDYRPYLGDGRLLHKIVYNSNMQSDCVYCGMPSDSREHIPSKVFLKKPYPNNLYIVPACKKCNNSYSDDELYSWFVIKLLEQAADPCFRINSSDNHRFSSYASIVEMTKKEIAAFFESQKEVNPDITVFDFRSNRLEHVLEKLAIGHSVFELSEGYRSVSIESWITESISYGFSPALSDEIKSDFDCAIPIDQFILPEIGSRIYDHIFVVQLPLVNVSNPSDYKNVGTIFLDWTDVQNETYRYITLYTGTKIHVYIVIDEFLFAAITFRNE
jgi:hypothetical protein